MYRKQNEIINEAKRVFEEEINSLLAAKERISQAFEQAVEILANSNKVVVTGIGKSGIIGKKIAATLSSIGIPSVFLDPVNALHGDIGIIQTGDTVVLLSKSGSTDEIVKLIPYLKSRSVKIIAIVGNMNSYLSREADCVLDASVDKEACPLNITPTTSTTVALAIGDALAVCLMMKKNVTIEDFSLQHPLGQLGRNITLRAKDIMHKNHALPIIDINGSFKDAIVEITNKGLGCVCVVNPEMKLKGIITDGDVRRTLQKNDDIRGLSAIDIMTKSPITIDVNNLLGEALSLMEQRDSQISVLPVVDNDNRCIGVIRLHDIIRSGL